MVQDLTKKVDHAPFLKKRTAKRELKEYMEDLMGGNDELADVSSNLAAIGGHHVCLMRVSCFGLAVHFRRYLGVECVHECVSTLMEAFKI